MKQYQVAIVGAGIGREHLEAYQALPTRFRVATLCDTDAGRAKEVIGNSSGTAISTSFESVLNDENIDIVDVCLPPHLHKAFSSR